MNNHYNLLSNSHNNILPNMLKFKSNCNTLIIMDNYMFNKIIILVQIKLMVV